MSSSSAPPEQIAASRVMLPVLRLGFAVLTTGIVISSLGPLAGAGERAAALCDGRTPTLVGTSEDDELLGTEDADVIDGLGGDDLIDGLGGDDLICGGMGADTLVGGGGADRLFGQADDVRLYQDSDHAHWGDTLVGGPGSDHLDLGGDFEPDYIEPEVVDFSDLPAGVVVDLRAGTATSGADVDTLAHYRGVLEERGVVGTSHDDRLIGTRDDDELQGGAGDDVIFGGHGGDLLDGGDDDDRLYGGPDHDSGRDPYEPQSRGDQLVPGPGDDLVATGETERTYPDNSIDFSTATRPLRVDVAAGVATGQGHDTLRVGGAVVVVGGATHDVVRGSEFDDVLVGDDGDDVLRGRGGSDELYGDGWWYYSSGGRGWDLLYGGDGRDFLDGGPLGDRLTGGPGPDWENDRPNINTCRAIEHTDRRGC